MVEYYEIYKENLLNILIIDSEYISLSKSKSTFKQIVKHRKIRFPEIFQFSLIKINNFKSFKITKKYNFYLKTKTNIPRRLILLTNLTDKKLKKKISFNLFLKKLNKLIKKNTIIIANGEDVKLLKMNIVFNRLKSLNKNINYINLRNITKEVMGKKLETEKLKKHFKVNIKLKSHNSLDDCIILFHAIKNIKKNKSFTIFLNLIKKNSEKIKL